MNNTVFRKAIENVRKLEINKNKWKNRNKKNQIFMDKPVYLGISMAEN